MCTLQHPLIPNVATREQGWAGADAVGLPPRFGEASGLCLGEQDSDLNSTRRDSNAEEEECASMTVKKTRGFCFVFSSGVRYVALSSSEMMGYQREGLSVHKESFPPQCTFFCVTKFDKINSDMLMQCICLPVFSCLVVCLMGSRQLLFIFQPMETLSVNAVFYLAFRHCE